MLTPMAVSGTSTFAGWLAPDADRHVGIISVTRIKVSRMVPFNTAQAPASKQALYTRGSLTMTH